MKTLTTLFVFLLFSSAFAVVADKFQDNSVSGTLERVERERNAKCEYKRSSIKISNGVYSWHKRFYRCIGNEGVFKMSMRVRTQKLTFDPSGRAPAPFVTKVIITKN